MVYIFNDNSVFRVLFWSCLWNYWRRKKKVKNKMVKRCNVVESKYKKDVAVFKVPQKNLELKEKWLKFLNRKDPPQEKYIFIWITEVPYSLLYIHMWTSFRGKVATWKKKIITEQGFECHWIPSLQCIPSRSLKTCHHSCQIWHLYGKHQQKLSTEWKYFTIFRWRLFVFFNMWGSHCFL